MISSRRGGKSRRPKNLIIRPELEQLRTSARVVSMTRFLADGLMSAGGTVIKRSREGGRQIIFSMEDGGGETDRMRQLFEKEGVGSVEFVGMGGMPEAEVRRVISTFSPEIALIPSPIEDKEAFEIFYNLIVGLKPSERPIRVLLYELRTPLLPNLVVDITPFQHLKERIVGSEREAVLFEALNRYRSVTNLLGRGFAEAFYSISCDELIAVGKDEPAFPMRLDKGPIPFFQGVERLQGWDEVRWEGDGDRKNILVLSPHYDDESIGCGGMVYRHIGRGDRVTVLFVTDGREGDPREGDPELVSTIRRREAMEAAEVLGVNRLEFLEQPETLLEPRAEVVRRLRKVIDDVEPNIVYLPSFLDNHIDHVELNRLFYRVLKGSNRDLEIRLFGLWTLIPSNLLVDIGDVIERKVQAVSKYRSQITQVDYLSVTLAVNRFWSAKFGDGKGYLEAYHSTGGNEYRKLVERLGINREMKF